MSTPSPFDDELPDDIDMPELAICWPDDAPPRKRYRPASIRELVARAAELRLSLHTGDETVHFYELGTSVTR